MSRPYAKSFANRLLVCGSTSAPADIRMQIAYTLQIGLYALYALDAVKMFMRLYAAENV